MNLVGFICNNVFFIVSVLTLMSGIDLSSLKMSYKADNTSTYNALFLYRPSVDPNILKSATSLPNSRYLPTNVNADNPNME